MRAHRRAGALAAAILAVLAFGAWQAVGTDTTALAQSGPTAGEIQLVYGVGGVLTIDGTLWQYRPDKSAWLTVDQAFAEEGRTTHVLPLPVPASQSARMESFGFIVTESGNCWLYDLEQDRWREIGPPPARR